MYYAGIAETIGVEVNLLTPEQIKEIWPLCNVDGIIGAIQHPRDGYVQPAELNSGLCKRCPQWRGRNLSQYKSDFN